MNINELYQLLPEDLHGNIAVSAAVVTITGQDGKAQTFELGAEVDSKAVEGRPVVRGKEIKGVNLETLISKL
jgi:hypothetical protein